jgi:hypothetical protein
MRRERGNWTDYRARFNLSKDDEVDLHLGRRDPRVASYDDVMGDAAERVMDSLRKAQENGRPHLMFEHGWSTSRPGATLAGSIVRGIMRSKEATPFIVRVQCIRHEAVFVAAIKTR